MPFTADLQALFLLSTLNLQRDDQIMISQEKNSPLPEPHEVTEALKGYLCRGKIDS